MATTFFLPLANLFAPFHALLEWFAPQPAAVSRPVRAPAGSAASAMAAKPLRVVRVFEPAAPRAGAGRMVISGRLADVCAELERLAAQEASGR